MLIIYSHILHLYHFLYLYHYYFIFYFIFISKSDSILTSISIKIIKNKKIYQHVLQSDAPFTFYSAPAKDLSANLNKSLNICLETID